MNYSNDLHHNEFEFVEIGRMDETTTIAKMRYCRGSKTICRCDSKLN